MNKIFKHKRGASGLKVVCEFAKSHCSSTEKSAINAGDYVASDLKTDKTKYFISGLKTLSIGTIFAVAISSISPVKAIALSDDYGAEDWGLTYVVEKDGGLFLYSTKNKNVKYGVGGRNKDGRGKQATMLNGYIASGEQSTVVGYESRGTSTQATALGARVGVYGSQGTAIGNDAYATALGAVAIGNDDMHGDDNANGKNLNASRTYDNHSLTEEELKNENLQKALHNIFCSKGGSANDTNGKCTQDEDKLKGFGLKYDQNTKKYVLDTENIAKEKAGKYSPLLAGGQGSISIGSRSISVGEGSTALGVLAKAYGDQSTALGTLSKAMGKNSFALGANSTATEENSMAFGVNSSATMKNSIAIGYGSKTDYTGSDTKAYMPGNGYAMPMAKSVGVVSVGSNGQPRRIVNLAAGALDTDAVNVSQLKALAENLGVEDISDNTDKAMRYLSVERKNGEAGKIQKEIQKEKDFKTYAQYRKYHDTMQVNIKKSGDSNLYGEEKTKLENEIKRLEAKHTDFKGKLSKPTGLDSLTTTSKEEEVKKVLDEIEKYTEKKEFQVDKDKLKQHNATNEGATGADALAFGYDAKAEGGNAISIGKGATATVTGGIALGAKSEAKIEKGQVGWDFSNNSGGATSTKTDKAWKSTDGAVSVGNDSVSRQITNLAAGTQDTDAVNVAQLKSLGTYVSQGFKVKGKGNGATDLENTIKFGSTLEFASADNGFVKVTHTKETNGNSKFTFDIDKEKLKKELGNIGGGTTASNLKFKGDIGEFTAQNEVNIKGGATDQSKLSDNNIGVEANNGNTLNVKLAKELKNLTSAEFKNGTSGTTMINGDGITYTPNGNTGGTNGTVSLGKDGISAGGKTIQNVGDATKSTDAVNKKQMDEEIKKVTQNIQNGTSVYFNAEADNTTESTSANGNKDKQPQKVANTKNIKFAGDENGNIKTSITQDTAGKTTVKFSLNETDLKIGKGGQGGVDGKITVAGKDNSVTIEGKDGSIGLTKDGTNTTITLKKEGKPDVEGADNAKMPRLTYTTQNGTKTNTHEIATLDDGLKFAGNTQDTKIKRKLNETLTIKGGKEDNTETSAENIWVETDTANKALNIKMAKALKGLTSAEFKNGTGTTKVDGDGITYTPNGNTNSNEKVSLGKNGISAGGKTITNVKAAENDTDAVNKGQVKDLTKEAITPDLLKEKIEAGTNIADISVKDGKLKINAKGAKVSLADNSGLKLDTEESTEANGNMTTYKLSLDEATKQKLENASTNAAGAMQNFKVAVNGTEATIGKDDTLKFAAGKNLTATLDQTNKTVTYAMKDDINFNNITAGGKGENGQNGKDGKVTIKDEKGNEKVVINGKDGTISAKGENGKDGVTINGKDGSIGLPGKDGTNGIVIKGGDGVNGVDGTSITRIVYKDKNNKEHQVATLDDGLKFAGNNGDKALKLNKQFTIKGADANKDTGTATTIWDTFDKGTNIMTKAEADGANGKLTIALAKALKGLTSAEFKNTAGDTTVINGDGVSYNKADNLKPDGSAIDPTKTVSLGKDGISAGGNKITNVKVAENDTDAVNKKQMDEAIKQQITENNTKTELKFAGDQGEAKAQDNKVTFAGGETDKNKLSDNPNIGVVAENGKLDIKLAKDIEVDSVTANKITAGGVTIEKGKISGVKSAVDPDGELAKKLAEIDKSSKTDIEKAKEKKDAIKAALDKVQTNNVATVGDLKNITDGLNSAVENVANNITKVTENITKATENIDETKKLIASEDDREKIKKAVKAAEDFKKDPSKKSEYEDAVKNNPLKTYNPYGTTVKNNTNVVEAIKNINERGVKFMHISENDKVGEGDDLSVNSNDSQANKKGSIGIGINAKSDAMDAIATGTNSKAEGENSIATGTNSHASGKNSIAMGNGAQAKGKNSISIGTGNEVTGENSSAIGDPNTVSGNNSHAYGNNNTIASDNTMVFGNNINVDKGIDQAVALGNQAKISVASGVALGANSNADRQALKSDDEKKSVYNGNDTGVKNTIKGTYGAVSVGDKDNTRQIINVAAGKEDSDAVNVAQLKAVANQIKNVSGGQWIAVSNGAKTAPQVANNVKNAVAVGDGSVANRDNTFSVGSAGNERIISNVADGVAPTDAANMRQLQSVANMVGEVKKDAMAGTASAMAIGNLPQATIPGKGMMAVGVGFYKGEQATALGVSKMSENGKWVFKASASYDSQRNVGAAGAIGFHF